MSNTLIRKTIIIVVALLMVMAVILIAMSTFGHVGKTPVHISAFPEDTIITMDGENINIGTLHLKPGTYKVEAKKDGYDNYSKTLVLEEKEQTVAIILVPNSEDTMKLENKDEAAYRKVQAQGEVAAAEAGKLFNERNPIAIHLPDKTFFYSIGYRMDQSDPSGNSIIIEIDASEAYREAALFRIRQLGYDPTDFNINFRNYENPFPL